MGDPVVSFKSNRAEFTVDSGEIVGLAGRSKSGKSTVARLVGGVFERPDGTQVDVDGDVGWLVAAVPIADPTDYEIGPFRVSLRTVTDAPAVVVGDELFDAVHNRDFVDEGHQMLRGIAARGSAVLIVSHAGDTIDDVCDRSVSLDGTTPLPRDELHRATAALLGPVKLAETDPVVQLRDSVDIRRVAIPVVDDDGVPWVLLPGIHWHARAVISWVHWRIVDPGVMVTLLDPPVGAYEAGGEADDGEEEPVDAADDDGPWYGLAASAPWLAAGVSYDPADPASVVEPLAVEGGRITVATRPQPRSAVFDIFEAGTPVVPTAEACADLIGRYNGRMRRLENDYGERWAADVAARDPLAAMVLNLARAANRRWWRIGVETWEFTVTRYGPGGNLARHADNYCGREVNKVSAIVQLSPPDAYEGGAVLLDHHARRPELDGEHWFDDGFLLPREPGTVAVFPSYLAHVVEPVDTGERYVLLLFAYGRPFR